MNNDWKIKQTADVEKTSNFVLQVNKVELQEAVVTNSNTSLYK